MTGIKCENINISTSIVKPFILCYVLSRTTIVYKTFLGKIKELGKVGQDQETLMNTCG